MNMPTNTAILLLALAFPTSVALANPALPLAHPGQPVGEATDQIAGSPRAMTPVKG